MSLRVHLAEQSPLHPCRCERTLRSRLASLFHEDTVRLRQEQVPFSTITCVANDIASRRRSYLRFRRKVFLKRRSETEQEIATSHNPRNDIIKQDLRCPMAAQIHINSFSLPRPRDLLLAEQVSQPCPFLPPCSPLGCFSKHLPLDSPKSVYFSLKSAEMVVPSCRVNVTR
jgi:hypothetical protein